MASLNTDWNTFIGQFEAGELNDTSSAFSLCSILFDFIAPTEDANRLSLLPSGHCSPIDTAGNRHCHLRSALRNVKFDWTAVTTLSYDGWPSVHFDDLCSCDKRFYTFYFPFLLVQSTAIFVVELKCVFLWFSIFRRLLLHFCCCWHLMILLVFVKK